MEHSFDIDVAQQIGVNCAIILKHLYFWIKKNAANEENFRDGMYWTYSSVKALEQIFPYLTGKQIRSALNKMHDDGIITTGNYNRSAYDRTTWYAITEKGFSILHIENFHLTKGQNGNPEKGEPIPDTITDTYIKTDIKEKYKRESFVPPTVEEVQKYCEENHLDNIDPENFVNFYGSKNWMVGKNKMTNWHMAASGWNRRSKENQSSKKKDDMEAINNWRRKA